MVQLKDTVNASGMRPEIGLAILVAHSIFVRHGHELIVTSVLDGKHSRTSLHYVGLAVDLRTKHLPAGVAAQLQHEIAKALGRQYDVLYEGAGTANEHLHIEFQPKS